MSRLVPVVLLLAVGSAGAQGPEPPPAIHLSAAVSPAFKLLSQPTVQAELRLTDRQREAVMILTDIRALSPHVWEAGSLGWITPELARAEIERQTREFLTKGLTKDQRARLDQVVYQLREKEFGAHAAFAMAARDLGLRAEQLEDVRHLKGQRVDEIVKHVTSGERYERVKARVAATNGDTFEKMAEMLTRAQRERLQELKGKAFEGKLEGPGREEPKAPEPAGNDPGLPLPKKVEDAMREVAPPVGTRVLIRRYPAALFGAYDLELRYLATPEVREELKISAEQGRKLDAALAEWSKAHLELPGLDLDRSGQLHDYTAKALNDILDPGQRERLDQIMMRRRLLVGPAAMCGHPAAVAALKVSPVQLRQLRDGRLVGLVLSRDQMAALEKLIGKPFELPAGVVDPLLARDLPGARVVGSAHQDGPDRSYGFARNFLVLSNRLKLSDEQIKKLRELAEDEPKIKELIRRELSFADTPPVAGAARTHSVAGAVMERYQAAVEEQCWKVLDDAQQSMARKIFGRGR